MVTTNIVSNREAPDLALWGKMIEASRDLDLDKIKQLLTKVFNEYFDQFRRGTYTSPDVVTYFYTLVDSKLGELFKEDQRLQTYFELHAFLNEAKAK